MQVEREAVSQLPSHTRSSGLGWIFPPPCANQQASPAQKAPPGWKSSHPQGFLLCEEVSGPGSLESGARLGPHSHPRSGCARHHRAPSGDLPRGGRIPVGPLCGSQPISHHGRVLLSSSHLLPHRHLKLG